MIIHFDESMELCIDFFLFVFSNCMYENNLNQIDRACSFADGILLEL